MESAKGYSHKILSILGLRATIIIALTISILVFLITTTAIKAHSESDVEYKQESIFTGAGLSTSSQNEPEINPNPIGLEDETLNTVMGMSYEVEKITPTPTPHIDPGSNDIWIKLAQCESHQNWKADTGNGYYGGLQFSLGAWASVGGVGKPSDASSDEQISKGKLLQQRRGWGPWGGCSKKLGLI